MTASSHLNLPDNTPIIIGAGQTVKRLHKESTEPFEPPMQLAAQACEAALKDAGVSAQEVDTIAVIRLFSDAAKVWASPFGGSNNPPESVAQRIGATPEHRIYSDAGGTEPLQIMVEMLQCIARGEKDIALLTGAEAIANQRFAVRNNYEPDWREDFDVPLDKRQHDKFFVSMPEINSGLHLPAHWYALIENSQAQHLGHDLPQHMQYMAQMMAPFSQVAAANPYAQFPQAYTPAELAQEGPQNYAISLPYSKLFVAQDAVNQAAALVLTSVGMAKKLGIDPQQWIFLEAYADGVDLMLSEREDPGRSAAMEKVFKTVLDKAQSSAADFDLIDIYSCFPSAVHAACEALGLPTDGSRALTVTGGLPYFGGPGNNYSLHALAEVAVQLRGKSQRALVTANGGMLSKHAAAVLSRDAARAQQINWCTGEELSLNCEDIPARPVVTDNPQSGKVISYTVIARRDKPGISIVLAETDAGERFLASSLEPAITESLQRTSPIGRGISVHSDNERLVFSFPDS